MVWWPHRNASRRTRDASALSLDNAFLESEGDRWFDGEKFQKIIFATTSSRAAGKPADEFGYSPPGNGTRTARAHRRRWRAIWRHVWRRWTSARCIRMDIPNRSQKRWQKI